MSSKKGKSRKTKQYKGQGRGMSQEAASTLLGEWTLLNKTRDAVSQILTHHFNLASWASQPGIFEMLEKHGDLALLQQRLRTYADDIDSVQRKFDSVVATHGEQYGKAKSPDDMMVCIDINSHYSQLGDAMAQLLVPMSATITEQINAANAARLLAESSTPPENQQKTETPE